MSSQEQQLFEKAHTHPRFPAGHYFLCAPSPCCTIAIGWAGDGWSAPSPLPRRHRRQCSPPRFIAKGECWTTFKQGRGLSKKQLLLRTTAGLRGELCPQDSEGGALPDCHRIQRELPNQTAVTLCQIDLSVENRRDES